MKLVLLLCALDESAPRDSTMPLIKKGEAKLGQQRPTRENGAATIAAASLSLDDSVFAIPAEVRCCRVFNDSWLPVERLCWWLEQEPALWTALSSSPFLLERCQTEVQVKQPQACIRALTRLCRSPKGCS